MTVAVDLGSGAVKVADAGDAQVRFERPIDPELAARVGTTVPLVRRDGNLLTTQAPHDAYVREVAAAIDGTSSDSVAIVAPDWWTRRAREVVTQTLQAHTTGPFQLVSPAVAAITASRERHRLPATVAVLDIGAESSSATVLTEVDGVHRVAGRPGVLHGQAGNDIDRRLMQHVLGWLSAAGHVYEPTDPKVAPAGGALLAQVKAAKERLSSRPAATLTPGLPGATAELRLVRSEFDEVIRGTVDAIVAMLRTSIGTNAPEGVGAVLLIGGSVSIPLVTQVISVQLGLPVVLDDDPATLAVRGAATITPPPVTKERRGWRRRRRRKAAAGRTVLDLDSAPAPDTEPLPDPPPNRAVAPSPGRRKKTTTAPPATPTAKPKPKAKTKAKGKATAKAKAKPADGTDAAAPEAKSSTAAPSKGTRKKSSPSQGARRATAPPVPADAPEPAHIVVEAGAGSSRQSARWTAEPEANGWDSARHTWVDGKGRFQLRVNDHDYEVDLGKELASASVTLLLMGMHVFVTASGSGAVLRDLHLNPDHDFRPE